MDTEYLKEYLVVADELSFTQAANKLHITQSTLSKHIAALEKEFQESLFVRSKRGLEITQAGGVLYRQAISMLNILEDTHSKIQAIRTQTPIRISGLTENNDIIMMLSQAIHSYQSSTEQQILLTPASSKSFIDLLCDNKIDIAICHQNSQGDSNPLLKSLELFQADMLAFVEPDHRLANRTSISIDDLKDEVFVHLTSTYAEYGWLTLLNVCKAHGFTPRSYPVDEQGIASCLILPLGGSVLVLQKGIISSNLLFSNRYVCLPIVDEDVSFSNCAYYREADEERLLPLLRCLSACVSSASDDNALNENTSNITRFKNACAHMTERYSLSENESIAMAGFIQGTSIDTLCERLKLSREKVGDLLASVYAKVGVASRQGLVDAITSMEFQKPQP